MSPVKQRLLSAIEKTPDFQLEQLLVILEPWNGADQDANYSGIQETEYLLSMPGIFVVDAGNKRVNFGWDGNADSGLRSGLKVVI